MRKCILTLIVLVVISISAILCGIKLTDNVSAQDNMDSPTLEVKTLSDIGNAKFAGSGSYYDDGMLKYANSGSTIGYTYDQSNSLLEFDVIFDKIKFPGWFSLTFKADGFDRTQSSNLSQKGYSFIIFPTGKVEVWKPGMTKTTLGTISEFTEGVKYRFKIGAYNNNEEVKLYLSVNETEIVNIEDSNNPYINGMHFNICGDGGTSARLFSTKKEIIPDYTTYTLSTIGDYPSTTASGVTYDKYKNVVLRTGTIGWNQGLENYSVEMNMNWSRFESGANIWVGMRVGGFDRANSSNLENKGYVVMIGRSGTIALYKNASKVTSAKWNYEDNTDYIFEFGCVDLDAERTMVFVNLNKKPLVSMVDSDNPILSRGMFNINGDGAVICNITSVGTKLTPLKTKVTETDSTFIVNTYFSNTISYTNMEYSDFSSVLLDSMLINDNSISDINRTYYSDNESTENRAVDVKYIDNRLVLEINKLWYYTHNNDRISFQLVNITLKKTGAETGLICPSGHVLKQTYYYSVVK